MVQVRGLGRDHRAYLWQYSRPGGSVVFDFQMGRGREGPRKFLGNYEGMSGGGPQIGVEGSPKVDLSGRVEREVRTLGR